MQPYFSWALKDEGASSGYVVVVGAADKAAQVLLEQLHTDGTLRTLLRGLTVVHREFLQPCRAAGLTAVDYPFNTAGRAIRALLMRLKAEMLRNFSVAAHVVVL